MPDPSDLAPLATRAEQPASTGSGVDETVPHPVAQIDWLAPTFAAPIERGAIGCLEPYRIVKELGHGGMGAVYAALDTRLDHQLALKVMLPQFAANPDAKHRFLRDVILDQLGAPAVAESPVPQDRGVEEAGHRPKMANACWVSPDGTGATGCLFLV